MLAVQGSHQTEVIFEPLTVFWVNSWVLPGHSSRIWIAGEATSQLILWCITTLVLNGFPHTLLCTFSLTENSQNGLV